MSVPDDKNHLAGKLFRAVINFLLNYVLQIAILLGLVFIQYGKGSGETGGYAQYIADNLSVFFFTVSCIFLLCWIIFLYYFFENKKFLTEMKNIWMIFLFIDLCLVICWLTGHYLHIYCRPFALFALLALFAVGYREAIFLNMVFSMELFLTDVFVNYNSFASAETLNSLFASLMICFIGGMFALFIGKSSKTRMAVLWTGVAVAIPTVIIIALLEVANYAADDWAIVTFKYIGFGAAGSVASSILFFAILPIFENIFSILTIFRLKELTSPDAKLLKRLKTEAPGTFNHSMVVAQIVESCASELGENVELARAAAYYHDVGKLRQPEFFTENQGEHNLHDELTPELSADIIRSHTKDGYDMLRAYHLPKFFAEVALEHHGTLPIKYFYAKAMRMSDGEINIENYSYIGPKPHSKIAAIVMIADACEAATRSLTDRSPKNVEQAVNGIIQERMELDQFSECEITMSELRIIKDTLVGTLTGVYHHRIKYPDVRFSRRGVEDKGGNIYDRRN